MARKDTCRFSLRARWPLLILSAHCCWPAAGRLFDEGLRSCSLSFPRFTRFISSPFRDHPPPSLPPSLQPPPPFIPSTQRIYAFQITMHDLPSRTIVLERNRGSELKPLDKHLWPHLYNHSRDPVSGIRARWGYFCNTDVRSH